MPPYPEPSLSPRSARAASDRPLAPRDDSRFSSAAPVLQPHPAPPARRAARCINTPPMAACPRATPPPVSLMHLPDEVLQNILRYLSSSPCAPQLVWDTPPAAHNSMAFALTCTRVMSLFRSHLISIRTLPERYRDERLFVPSHPGAVVHIHNPAMVSHLAAVIRLSGPALRELHVVRNIPYTHWVDAFVQCASNIRKLSFHDVSPDFPLDRLLAVSARTLKHLDIVGATGVALSQSQLNSLATHASAVHTLSLRLSMFDHDWTPVWMGLGPGLQSLSLGATRYWIMDTEENVLLQQIGRYCPDLRHLQFYHLGPTLGAAAVTLCARYGNSLHTLQLEQSQLHRRDLLTLAAACPKASISISHGSSLFSHSYNADVIDVLGPLICSLRYRSQLAHDESLCEIGRQCISLRELRLDCASTLTEAALESILKATALRLTSFSAAFFVRGLERATASSAVNLLSQYSQALQDLHIGGQTFDTDAFRKIANRCRHSLKRVSVTFGFRTAGDSQVIHTNILVEVIKALYCCESLNSLVILDRTCSDNRANAPEIASACYPIRERVERITVCGVDYIR